MYATDNSSFITITLIDPKKVAWIGGQSKVYYSTEAKGYELSNITRFNGILISTSNHLYIN